MYKKRGEETKRGFFAKHRLLIAITTLIGTIIGAGILAIPYVVSKVGFFYGFILIIIIGIAFLFLNLYTGEVVLRTKEQHQLTGYAEKYLGRWGKHLMMFILLFSIYGALIAYLIGEGETLKAIFHVGNPIIYTFIFFAVASLIVYKGIKAAGNMELFLISTLFLVVVLISIFSFDYLSIENFSTFDITKLLLPYGVILFAFMGTAAVPEMQEELGKEKKKMKTAIIIGSVIPIILYIVFTVVVMGIVGLGDFEVLEPNQRIATVALSMYSHPLLGTLANVLAVLAMFTSFLTLSIALIEIYHFDYGISRNKSLLLTFSLPLAVVIFDITTFISVIAITGSVAGGLEGILLILTYWKAKKLGRRKPEYSLRGGKLVGLILIVMFALGIVYQVWSNLF